MHFLINACSMLVVCTLLMGCGKHESVPSDGVETEPVMQMPIVGGGGVAIVDLDGVSRQLGRDVDMAELIAARETELNQQLEEVQQALRQQYDILAHELSLQTFQLAEEQAHREEQLASYDRQLGAQLQQARQVARNELQKYQAEVISRFREEAKPFTRAVAKERGLSIVMTLDEVHMLAYASSVDITDAVAERMALGNSVLPGGAPTATRPSSVFQR